MKIETLLNFHHIFKTAGTTVTAMLQQFFAHGESINSGTLSFLFRKQTGNEFYMLNEADKHKVVNKNLLEGCEI